MTGPRSPQTPVCRSRCGARSAWRFPAPTPIASTPSSKRPTAACSCPTTRGATWKLVNDDRRLRQRAFYYTRIYADPQAKDTVYVLNTGFYRSTDGGKTSAPFACRTATITISGSRRTIRSA